MEKKIRRRITIIFIILTILSIFLFFILQMNPVVGIVVLVLCVLAIFFNNEKWANRFAENLGIGIIGGLIVSFIMDVYSKTLNSGLEQVYFISLGFCLLLLIKGASKGEDI